MKYHLGDALKHLLLVLGGGICGLGALGMRRLSSLVGELQCSARIFLFDATAVLERGNRQLVLKMGNER
jgi:hypothetical protein